MENKINVAELLEDCPKGMELDCTIYEDVYFDYVDELNIIHCYIQHETHKTSLTFNQHGTPNSDIKSKCVIFPKDKTTWEGFRKPFKDGDIVATNTGMWVGIVKKPSGGDTCEVYVGINTYYTNSLKYGSLSFSRPATEKEKQKLFQAIKDNGYKWNPKTKTLEKLIVPKFKVGDRIRNNRVDLGNIYTIIEVRESSYVVNKNNEHNNYNIDFVLQDEYELVPNKFDITTLKPFDKVLVRCDNNGLWNPQFFAKYRPHSKFPFTCTYNSWSQCVPYEGNEHLLDTTNNCNDFYKTW